MMKTSSLTQTSLYMLATVLFTQRKIKIKPGDSGWFLPGGAEHAEVKI